MTELLAFGIGLICGATFAAFIIAVVIGGARGDR